MSSLRLSRWNELSGAVREAVEGGLERLLSERVRKGLKLEPEARALVYDHWSELLAGLCGSRLPASVAEVDRRVRDCEWGVMRPLECDLEPLRSLAVKGKRGKLVLPHDKVIGGLKSIYGQFDVNVMLYVLAITESIIQKYIEVGNDYQLRSKKEESHILYFTTMQIIFSKYDRMEEQLLSPIYTSINKMTKHFSQNYTDNIKNFILFLRDSREQLEILIKIFKQPLEAEENIPNIFGNIGDVLDSLSLVLDTLDDSTDVNRKYMAMDIMDLAEMELFTPFKDYVQEVLLNNNVRVEIERLIKTDATVDKIIFHYNSIIGSIFSKCSQKRCNDLMIRYRVFHSCDNCRNPQDFSRPHKTSLGLASPVDEHRSEDSGYVSSIQQLSLNQERVPSSGSSVTSNSDSPRVTRGSSPMDLDINGEDRLRISRQSLGFIRCNLLLNCYKYLLPRLLLFPVFQFMFIYQILDVMSKCQSDIVEEQEEMRNLEIVVGMLKTISFKFENILCQTTNFQTEFTRLQSFFRIGPWSQEFAKDSNAKLSDIKRMVKKEPDNWEWPSGGNSEFIMEGSVQIKINSKKAYVDRYLYLFSNMLLISKKQVRKTGLAGNQVTDMKLKQRILLEQFHIEDREENEDLHSFTLEYFERKDVKQSNSTGSSPSPGQKSNSMLAVKDTSSIYSSTLTLTSLQTITDQSSNPSPDNYLRPINSITIFFTNIEDKIDWIASLLQLQTKKLFNQYIIIKNIEEVPLKMPEPSVYRFAEPDMPYNIEYESTLNENSGEIPVIKMATLEKLITHLTYHAYCDGKTLNSFLLIFRNFTTAEALLDLLIERFNIPNPVVTETTSRRFPYNQTTYEDRILKKFRTAYKRKMQLRVVNFVTKWINNIHYFKMDFASNLKLLEKLQSFLGQNMVSPHLALKIKNVKKNIDNRLRDSFSIQNRAVINADSRPPMINLPLCLSSDKVSVINVHPLELARQITLYEWRLYSKIEFWEVNGREKQDGPNFSASIEFSNKILYWLIYEIMKHRNLYDRVTAIFRVADLMQIFEHMNNLQGAQECKGALISASVYRLKDTFDYISNKYKTSYRILFEKLRNDYEESSDSYIAQYQKKIHNISAPGLPYIAMGDKTQLIHMNLKNPNYFTRIDSTTGEEVKLINFWKFRQMSELIEHYLSFQNTPYNFQENHIIQTFLDQVDIFSKVTVKNHYEFDDFVHDESLVIQPRFGEAKVFPDRVMTNEEIKMANILNNLSIKDKLSDSCKLMPDSPPPLPPKVRSLDSTKKSGTPEPILTPKQLPPVPERPPTSKKEGYEYSASQSDIDISSRYSHSPSDIYTPIQKTDVNTARPPPVPSRPLSRESRNSPPLIPPRLPPLPPKGTDHM